MTKDGFDFEVDEEGVVRILDMDPEDSVTFTVRDFGRLLTELLSIKFGEDEEDAEPN